MASHCRGSGLEASKADVLDLQILVDAVLGALTAQTRLFDAAKRGLRCGQQALVHANYPRLQRLRHPPRLTDVLRVEVT